MLCMERPFAGAVRRSHGHKAGGQEKTCAKHEPETCCKEESQESGPAGCAHEAGEKSQTAAARISTSGSRNGRQECRAIRARSGQAHDPGDETRPPWEKKGTQSKSCRSLKLRSTADASLHASSVSVDERLSGRSACAPGDETTMQQHASEHRAAEHPGLPHAKDERCHGRPGTHTHESPPDAKQH
jgi:hypothetical protein